MLGALTSPSANVSLDHLNKYCTVSLLSEWNGAYLECGGFRRFGSERMGCTNNLRMAKLKRRSNQSGAEPRTPNSSRVVGKILEEAGRFPMKYGMQEKTERK